MSGRAHTAIRAVAVDLDGTLLSSAKQVAPRNLRALLACKEQGLAIVIATARPPRSVRALLPRPLLEAAALVCYNGAWAAPFCLSDMATFQRLIPQPAVDRIVAHATQARPNHLIACESDDRMYTNRPPTEEESRCLGIMPGDAYLPVALPLAQLIAKPLTKILLPDWPAPEELARRFASDASIVTTDGGRLVQMMAPEVSKELGVAAVLEPFGIRAEQVIAFGDDANDAGLFAWAGHAVAMANAAPALMKLARATTASNDEDGVAQTLEQLLAIASLDAKAE